MFLTPPDSGLSIPQPVRSRTFWPFRTPPLGWICAFLIAAIGVAAAIYPIAAGALFAALLLSLWISRIPRDPLIGIIGAFTFYPLCAFMRSTYGAYKIPIWTSGVRLIPEVSLILVFVTLIARARKTKQPFRIYSDDLPVLSYILAGVYSFIVAAYYLPIYGPLNGWWVSVTPTMFYIAVRFLRPTAADTQRFSRFFLISFVVLAVPSFYQYIVRPEWIIHISQAERPYFADNQHATPIAYWRLYSRMESLLFEENVWGTLCAFVLLYCLAGLQGRKTPRLQIVAIGFALSGMILSQSRGSWVTFMVGLLVLLVMRGHHRGRIIAALAATAAIGGVVMLRWGSQDLGPTATIIGRMSTLTDADSKTNASSDRSFQWMLGWDIFKLNPSGAGLGTVGYAAHLSGVGAHKVADGIYFRILAEQGVPGALMIVYALIGTGWVLWRYVFDYTCSPPTRRLGLTLFAFHCGFVIQSIGANTYDFWYLPSLFWTFFGFFVTRCQSEQAWAAERDSARIWAHLETKPT